MHATLLVQTPPHGAGAPSKEPRFTWKQQQQPQRKRQHRHGPVASWSQRRDPAIPGKPAEGRANEMRGVFSLLVPTTARRRAQFAGAGKGAVNSKATQVVQKLQMSKRCDLRAGGSHKSKGMAMAEARMHHSLVARLQKAPEVCGPKCPCSIGRMVSFKY
jgi:hypothetical protein